MALQIQEAEMGVLKKEEGKPVQIPYPEEVSMPELEPIRCIEGKEAIPHFGSYRPKRPKLDYDTMTWNDVIDVDAMQNNLVKENEIILTDGIRFEATKDGVYTIKRGGERQQITNAVIEISRIKRIWVTEKDFSECYVCEVYCREAWGEIPFEIEIEKNGYKNLYKKIHQEFPAVFLSNQDVDTLNAYLTKVFQQTSGLLIENVYQKIGWLTVNGETAYRLGVDPYYSEFGIPDIGYCNKTTIFQNGFYFLNVGKFNNEISTLWLTSHIAYSLYWLNEAGVKFHSILFLKGKTNLFKTAVASVLTNIFCLNREKALIRLSSTPASLQEYLSKSQDNLVCIDDFSNTVGADNQKLTKNAEFVIRAVGDGQFSGKMKIGDLKKIKDTSIRCAVVVTGEEGLSLSLSSDYRMIVLNILEGTFNPAVLSTYQAEPAILRNYFALYIKFLTENHQWIVQYCREKLPLYRKEFYQLEVPRFVDSAVALSLQVDILRQFAKYCGIDDSVENFWEGCYEMILNVLRQNQKASATGNPEIRFISALMQSIGTDSRSNLAGSEEQYIEDEGAFIGFWDRINNQIWLRFPEAYALVKRYYSMQGEYFIAKEQTIKELLVRKGIAEGKLSDGKGGNEFLVKAKKGTRKRMLVLNVEKVNEILEGENSNA